MMHLLAIVVGFMLDLVLGDPKWLPHPICLIGNLISLLEKKLRSFLGETEQELLLSGKILVVLVGTLSFCVPWAILFLATMINEWLAFTIEIIMFYQIFAMRSLRDESMKVYTSLEVNDLVDARLKLSWIVGRDTKELSREEVTKGAIETISENTADGVVAPMLYMFIGGAPLAFFYKGINTMDSMVGYKNEKYMYFGRCAAKLDDLANYIPARITGLAMLIATYLLSLDTKQAWKIFKRDRYNHLSPNSAMTESVAAGALNIQLGGGHFYFGQWVHKETIGDNIKTIVAEDIVQTNNLMYMTAIISILLFSLVYLMYLFLEGRG